MPIVNVTLPSDGTGADVGDYNTAILAILAVLNGHIASDNIEPASLDWSVMSGTMTNVIPSTAMQDSGSMEKWRDESDLSYVVSGLIWSAVSGLNGTMSSGMYYSPNGIRYAVGSVASRAFTASKDTYISISPTGTIAYQEVANGANMPLLSANYRWLYKVVSSGAALTSFVDLRSISPITVYNVDSFSFGEKLVKPANFTAIIAANFAPQDIPGSTITVYVPAGCIVEVSYGCSFQSATGANSERDIILWDNIANASVSTTIHTTGAISVSSHQVYYSTVSGSDQFASFRLRGNGNGANGSSAFDFRNLYLKTRILKLTTY